jgi:UDP-glucuronate decarboxylase
MAIELSGSASKLKFSPTRPDDPMRRRPDITLARKHLNWQPQTALRKGLATTVEHFRNELGLARS